MPQTSSPAELQPGEGNAPTLARRVALAGSWALLSRILVRILGFARIIVLARLLTPSDFGLMAIALAAVLFLDTLTRAGLGAALVQKPGDIDGHLDSAWSVNLVRAALISGLLFFGAPYLATFFNSDGAAGMLRAVALVTFLRHISNPGIIHFQKDLEFNRMFRLEASRAVLETIISIALALWLRNAWALVFGFLAGEITALIASYLMHPYRPRWSVEWIKVRELYRFGKWVYLGTLFDAVTGQVDKALLARVLGPASLGVYQMGTRLSYALSGEISYGVFGVAFPTFAQLQDEIPRLRRAYLKTLELVSLLMLPFAIATLFLADGLVHYLLGPHWIPATPVIKVLAFAGALQALGSPLRALFYGLGRPALNFWSNSLGNAMLLVTIYPLAQVYGVTGVALAVLLSNLVKLPLQIAYARTILQVPVQQLVGAFLPGLMVSLAVGLALGLMDLGIGFSGIIALAFQLGLAGATYLVALVLLWRIFDAGPLPSLVGLRSTRAS